MAVQKKRTAYSVFCLFLSLTSLIFCIQVANAEDMKLILLNLTDRQFNIEIRQCEETMSTGGIVTLLNRFLGNYTSIPILVAPNEQRIINYPNSSGAWDLGHKWWTGTAIIKNKDNNEVYRINSPNPEDEAKAPVTIFHSAKVTLWRTFDGVIPGQDKYKIEFFDSQSYESFGGGKISQRTHP